MGRYARRAFLALALILGGGLLAAWIQTDGGAVRLVDVRIPGPGGIFQHGRLYIPDSATSETPAPGIVAIHGYINSLEMQSGFAIEFARRGWVVLAVDQTGHGFSDPPSGANGNGGPPALAFLRTLDFVDPANVGLEGHSMGGWASVAAAGAYPGAVRSIVLQGAGIGFGGDGSTLPNVAVVFSEYDEFAGLMWGVPEARRAGEGDRMRAFFGTEAEVEPGRVYGSIEEGTARIFHQPPVTHPGDHHSRAAIGHAVDWFQRTLDGGRPLDPSNQVWYWKELGTLLAGIGMILLLFPVAGALLERPFFAELAGRPQPSLAPTGPARWGTIVLFVALPAATLFPFKDLYGRWGGSASALLPQNLTSQVATWALLVGAISAGLFLVWHGMANRSKPEAAAAYGLGSGKPGRPRRIAKAALLAFLVVGTGYLTLVASEFLFRTDYRFWVFSIKRMSPLHLRMALSYLVPFTLFFLVLATALHGQLRRDDRTLSREIVGNVGLLAGGFVVLLAWQYGTLFTTGTLAIEGEALWTILAIQFLPLMTIVGALSTWLFRRTGEIYAGAFASAFLVTWIVVASQATHYPF